MILTRAVTTVSLSSPLLYILEGNERSPQQDQGGMSGVSAGTLSGFFTCHVGQDFCLFLAALVFLVV